MSHTAGFSKVGQHTIYESDNQRNVPRSEINERQRYKEGQQQSHLHDSKAENSVSNRLAGEGWPKRRHKELVNPEEQASKQDPTKPASLHGNKPSRGAEIDKELRNEDELRLKEVGIKK